jgi:ATP/maltotriose-dependent transcriptional regulator MalT
MAATAVTRLVGAMSAMTAPVGLVLDHIELVSNQDCRDAIAELALRMPVGSQLAIATRRAPPLPIGQLRAAREVVEVGVDDLAMDGAEARVLLEAVGFRLGDADHSQLIERTEGWPVGLPRRLGHQGRRPRHEPEFVPRLHLGAAAWYQANSHPELAIDHAGEAGDPDRVGRLVLEVMQPVWASGRVDTVLRWMEWFDLVPRRRPGDAP